MALSPLTRIHSRELKILVLVRGKLVDGRDYYAYASIPESRYHAFKDAQAAGSYNLRYFGDVLMHGEGREPSHEVKRRVENEYGINHRFEEEFSEWVQQFTPAIALSGSNA